MSVTVSTVRTPKVQGDERWSETDVTFDSSYPTGGEPVTASQFGLGRVISGFAQLVNGSESETDPVGSAFFDVANMKLKLNNSKTSKEIAGEKDMSKVIVRVFAGGK
jgi:hypothetical protein